MKKEIALLLISTAFVAGFFIGRRFPAHRFTYYERSGIAFDPITGKACDPVPPSKPIDAGNGFTIADDDSRLPPCGGK
jgi:hypothetical protein